MARNNKKDMFVLKQFSLGKVSGLLVAMEKSGVVKITYTDDAVEVTIWDNACERILHRITCKHEDLTYLAPEEETT